MEARGKNFQRTDGVSGVIHKWKNFLSQSFRKAPLKQGFSGDLEGPKAFISLATIKSKQDLRSRAVVRRSSSGGRCLMSCGRVCLG